MSALEMHVCIVNVMVVLGVICLNWKSHACTLNVMYVLEMIYWCWKCRVTLQLLSISGLSVCTGNAKLTILVNRCKWLTVKMKCFVNDPEMFVFME